MRDALQVRGLWKSYGERAILRELSFTVEAGELLCVMAPSGTGKTTLLRLLLGLETADRGEIRLPGTGRWSAVFQEDRLLEGLDAWGNLRFALGGACEEGRARRLLAELGLEEAGNRPVRQYSGGMRRRLSLIRALLAEGDCLALDEPFAGLDGENRLRCREAILRERGDRPTVLVTHDPEDAAGERILRL